MMQSSQRLTAGVVCPTQVWAQLAAERQAHAIRLMAQLAFNLVAVQPDVPSQESYHASKLDEPQNPA